VQVGTVRLLAVLMGATHGVVWVVGSRWERLGRTAQLRASLRGPPLAVREATWRWSSRCCIRSSR
jgi:hypothetical protein